MNKVCWLRRATHNTVLVIRDSGIGNAYRTLRHQDSSAPVRNDRETVRHQNKLVPKCPGAEVSWHLGNWRERCQQDKLQRQIRTGATSSHSALVSTRLDMNSTSTEQTSRKEPVQWQVGIALTLGLWCSRGQVVPVCEREGEVHFLTVHTKRLAGDRSMKWEVASCSVSD